MQIEKSPIFRKVFIPWYDSNKACLILILFLVLVLFFSITGIVTAYSIASYSAYAWVPIVLTIISIFIIASVIVRMILRRFNE